MRVCLAPKARCIYLGNDSHLEWQGVCVCVCVCVVQYAVAARFLFGWLTAWLRGEFADLFAGKNTTVAFVFLFSPFVLFFPPFFNSFCKKGLLLKHPLSPSLHHPSLPLLIHKNTSHRWMASIGTGAWFDPTAHTLYHVYTHCCLLRLSHPLFSPSFFLLETAF